MFQPDLISLIQVGNEKSKITPKNGIKTHSKNQKRKKGQHAEKTKKKKIEMILPGTSHWCRLSKVRVVKPSTATVPNQTNQHPSQKTLSLESSLYSRKLSVCCVPSKKCTFLFSAKLHAPFPQRGKKNEKKKLDDRCQVNPDLHRTGLSQKKSKCNSRKKKVGWCLGT